MIDYIFDEEANGKGGGGQSPTIKFINITKTNNFVLVWNEFNYLPSFEERFYVQMPQSFVYTKEGPKNEWTWW